MKLTVPDEILIRGELNETELRLALAVQLYADNRIDHADACRLAAVQPPALNRELLRLGLSIQQYPGLGPVPARRTDAASGAA
jgi:predicted HTH domain antitoxin